MCVIWSEIVHPELNNVFGAPLFCSTVERTVENFGLRFCLPGL